ncbi:ROK family protein [Verrucomicrobiaceae bacterium 227]
MSRPLIATLESGGTKMVAALSRGPGEIFFRERIPTTTPEETISRLVSYFKRVTAEFEKPEALVIGTFGPADLDPASPAYGFITKTPKPHWSGTDLLGPLQKALGVPAMFETDVAASLFGEATWGAARGLKHAAYFTVGTGIGGALMIDGKMIHGVGHPEMGHMRVSRHEKDDFKGACPFHHDCLEGMAAGTSINQRWELPAEELPVDHPAWEIEASYLAQACLNLLMIAPPERIVLGGGVMHQRQLFPLVRAELTRLLDGYLGYEVLCENLEDFIVAPALGDDSGVLGCVALGQRMLSSRQ